MTLCFCHDLCDSRAHFTPHFVKYLSSFHYDSIGEHFRTFELLRTVLYLVSVIVNVTFVLCNITGPPGSKQDGCEDDDEEEAMLVSVF